MLQSLSVKNFILIDSLELEFDNGLCVITGETGAGKSILLNALLFCLGKKLSSDVIKTGSDYCSVTAIFSLNDDVRKVLDQANIEYDTELIIKRIQKPDNRKKFLINDQLVTQNTLSQVADHLFELHGQNNHTSLLNSSSHIDILDNYGNLLDLRTKTSQHFSAWQKITNEISKIIKEKDKIDQEIDYLMFSTKELQLSNVQIGEEEKLVSLRQILQSRDKELSQSKEILSQLETSEIDQSLSKASRLINRSQHEFFTSISLNLDNIYHNLEEARAKIKSYISDFDKSEYNLEEIEERLFEIRGLARKYNIRCDEIMDFLNKSQEQLNILQNKISSISEWQVKQDSELSKYFDLANILSHQRIISARNLERLVQQELSQLKMEKAIFKVEVISNKGSSSHGTDNICFIASTNPGMALAPIDKIASGGELSRFMLALKTSLFTKKQYTTTEEYTLIFDEIDTGIGGYVADKVGERLKKLSNFAQVIVITHQPQVAGKASQHISVSKSQQDKTTEVKVKVLDLQERQYELARMISGKTVTEASLNAAKELL